MEGRPLPRDLPCLVVDGRICHQRTAQIGGGVLPIFSSTLKVGPPDCSNVPVACSELLKPTGVPAMWVELFDCMYHLNPDHGSLGAGGKMGLQPRLDDDKAELASSYTAISSGAASIGKLLDQVAVVGRLFTGSVARCKPTNSGTCHRPLEGQDWKSMAYHARPGVLC